MYAYNILIDNYKFKNKFFIDDDSLVKTILNLKTSLNI